MEIKRKLREFLGLEVEDRKEPQKYIIETSTFPELVQEKMIEGITTAMHAGATVIEVTASHPASFATHIKRELKKYMKQENLKLNLHATMYMRTSKATRKDYERVQDYLDGYLDVADELDADYLNVHTSAFPSPILSRITGESRGTTVTPDGDPVEDFIIEMAKNQPEVFGHIVDILDKTTYTRVIDRYARSDVVHEMAREKAGEKNLSAAEPDVRRRVYEEARNEFITRKTQNDEEIIDRAKEVLREKFRDMDRLPFRTGYRSIDELTMYRMMAWKMYEEKDPLWIKICGDKDPEKVERDNSSDMVDAVAGKYLQGHFGKLRDKIEKTGVKVTLETPDARESEYIGYYRLVKIKNIYHVVKSINNPLVRLCVDFEHIASHGIDPLESVKNAPSNVGEVTEVVHISGEPVPGHTHKPIRKGDIDLYEMLWHLRKKGFKGGYLNFERGGGGKEKDEGPYQESLPRLKEIAVFLENDISPDELPGKFYGYDDWEYKRDHAVIRTHLFDPIKGLIESPDLQDTFLGEHAAVEKRMGEDWKREEHR